ncbi:MAG: hypothetical protein HWN66_03420 [Candidatus Helarchaeota archaeon]|nr:hypothetical protein [Candidatus Helarchaeota archaeon]
METPWLDGILARAMNLVDEWLKQKPDLVIFPNDFLLFQAIGCADVMRMLEGFKKAGIEDDLARSKVHSHLQERLAYAGLYVFFYHFTFFLDQAASHWPIDDDPLALPTNFGLIEEHITEKELRKTMDFGKSFPKIIGPEATEHLLQAVLAFDRWVREEYKSTLKKYEKEKKK